MQVHSTSGASDRPGNTKRVPVKQSPPLHVSRRRRAREARLRQLGYASYAAYLRCGHRQDVRRAYRASDRPQACQCGETDVDLHHMTYERIGAEELTDLIALCRRCHQDIHALEFRGDIGLDMGGLESPERAAEYAQQAEPARERVRAQAQQAALHKRDRRIRDQIKRITKRAAERGIDISDQLDIIEQALIDAEARL